MVNKVEETSTNTAGVAAPAAAAAADTEPGTSGAETGGPPEPPKMRSVMLNSYGGLKGVQVGNSRIPSQEVGPSEVLVKSSMSCLNFGDLMTRLGVIDSPPKIPFVMGSELVGRVEEVGKDVTRLKLEPQFRGCGSFVYPMACEWGKQYPESCELQAGDLVYALPEYGAWAEYVTVDEKYVWTVTRPKLDLKVIANSLGYLVAHYLVQGTQPGSSVLVHSAGGSVGLAVRDLAKLQGCKVLGICSGTKMEKVAGFETLIDRTFDYVAEIKKLYPEGVNLVLDPQGGEDCMRGLTLLSPGGKYVLYGSANIVTGETKSFFSMAKSWWQVEKVSPLKLYEENKFIGGLHLRNLLKTKHDEVAKVLERIWGLMETGQLKPVVDSVLAFEEVTSGMQKMHDRKNIGKILIDPNAKPKSEVEEASEAADNGA